MTSPLVHVGLHRTGSTWFQTRLLDGREGRPRHAVPDRSESTRRIILPRDLDFDATAVRSWLQEAFARSIESGSAPVISNERFSGNPAGGWYDFERSARRLAAVVPEGRVFLAVRAPHDLLRSIWLQQVRIGHPAGIEDFLRPPERGDHRLPAFDPEFLRFDRLVAHLDDLFGGERVLVLPYELLRTRPEEYVRRLEDFSGISFPAPDLNRVFAAPSILEVEWLRRVNLLATRSSLNPAAPLPGLESSGRRLAALAGRCATSTGERRRGRRIDAVIDRRLAEVDLEGSRRRLSERIGLDLETFGWRD